MGVFTFESWALIAAVIGTAVFGTLYILASILRDAARRVDLYRRVADLRADYARQYAEHQARGNDTIEYVDAVDAVEPPNRQAA